MSFVSIAEAIEEIRRGRMLVVVDDEDRENEGDLTIAAEKVTPEVINFMATNGRGLICLALTGERCDQLRLPLMSPNNTSVFGTAFCEAIDAREGVTTGLRQRQRHHALGDEVLGDHRGLGLELGGDHRHARPPRRRRQPGISHHQSPLPRTTIKEFPGATITLLKHLAKGSGCCRFAERRQLVQG